MLNDVSLNQVCEGGIQTPWRPPQPLGNLSSVSRERGIVLKCSGDDQRIFGRIATDKILIKLSIYRVIRYDRRSLISFYKVAQLIERVGLPP